MVAEDNFKVVRHQDNFKVNKSYNPCNKTNQENWLQTENTMISRKESEVLDRRSEGTARSKLRINK